MSIPQLFDRPLLRKRRDRIAGGFHSVSYLKDFVSTLQAERLSAIKRTFSDIIDLGGSLSASSSAFLMSCDLSEKFASQNCSQDSLKTSLVVDEEFLPFAEGSCDLFLSTLTLHWVNDLPGTLAQIHRILRPDGLFMASLLGGETLRELRECLQEAELHLRGGISPRFSPLITVRDAGSLLQRAGFALPVADHDLLTVTYDNPWDLMRDLKNRGETNCLYQRERGLTSKSVFDLACDLYQQRYTNSEGKIIATFDLIHMAGWAPHESQQKALKRGSAQRSLSTALC